MRLLIIAHLLAALGAAPAWAAPPPDPDAAPGQLVRLPDGRRLNFRCSGTGSPTVILESGFGADSLAWPRVRARLERKLRVCSYDRAGYGFSDPGPLPRDGAAIARDLDRGLRAARIRGPFVLVGHSAGALYVRALYARRPGDVAGMVLVDPSVEHQDRRFAAAFGPGAGSTQPLRDRAARCQAAAEQRQLPSTDPALERCAPPADPKRSDAMNAARRSLELRPATWRTQVSELDNLWTATSDQLDASTYGDLPMIVLTADGTYSAAPEQAREALSTLWFGLHRELARRSNAGVSRRINGSSHLMMRDKPDAVADAVLEIAAKAKMANTN
ncbi:alpha/beta fold hydrolase [Phenylobacterium sp.]|jgi:pimeloyl-ACP methyl ester carboxylesterase|uniref:alpha/beta fold hydrolase n=1 Tax=Phenylobacterium sp. TaxID=1871053 RepID=UPI0035B27B0B